MRQKWVLACQSFGEHAVRVKLELTDFSFAHDDSEWKKIVISTEKSLSICEFAQLVKWFIFFPD